MDHRTAAGRRALNTLKTARGQIDGAIAMLEADRYCIDVSKQILAAAALLRKANSVILRQHMNTCVAEALTEGGGAEKLDEIMRIVDSYVSR